MKAAALAILLHATAYVPANPVGATGEPVLAGMTCALPRSHRALLGTWVTVNGRSFYANDITAKHTTGTVDIALESVEACREFGRRRVEVSR